MVDDDPITSGTVALYCQDNAQFDNVMITEATLQPTVAIATPLTYSVALTEDDGNSLSVEAVALNMPSGGSVGFTLNDNAEVAVSSSRHRMVTIPPSTPVWRMAAITRSRRS